MSDNPYGKASKNGEGSLIFYFLHNNKKNYHFYEEKYIFFKKIKN